MALARKGKMVPGQGAGKMGKLTRKLPQAPKQKTPMPQNPMVNGGNGPGMMPGFG